MSAGVVRKRKHASLARRSMVRYSRSRDVYGLIRVPPSRPSPPPPRPAQCPRTPPRRSASAPSRRTSRQRTPFPGGPAPPPPPPPPAPSRRAPPRAGTPVSVCPPLRRGVRRARARNAAHSASVNAPRTAPSAHGVSRHVSPLAASHPTSATTTFAASRASRRVRSAAAARARPRLRLRRARLRRAPRDFCGDGFGGGHEPPEDLVVRLCALFGEPGEGCEPPRARLDERVVGGVRRRASQRAAEFGVDARHERRAVWDFREQLAYEFVFGDAHTRLPVRVHRAQRLVRAVELARLGDGRGYLRGVPAEVEKQNVPGFRAVREPRQAGEHVRARRRVRRVRGRS